jgi:exo-1,4-beta-D-glucosaminidase
MSRGAWRFRRVFGAGFRTLLLSALALSTGLTCAFLTSVAAASTVDLAPRWQVQSSAIATDPGDQVSQRSYQTTNWLQVRTNDANAVGGEVAAQIQNIPPDDQCGTNNIFYSDNLVPCQGAQPDAHGLPNAPYDAPWWFRTQFTPKPKLGPDQNATLEVRGVMGEADLWVNGVQVATRDTIQGSEAEYDFDITDLVQPGANVVAFKIYPNDPSAMLTQDFNDWTQTARDQNTGIKYPVRLHISNALQLSDMHVVEDNASDMSSSDLTVKGTVTNTSNEAQTGDVDATVTDPQGNNPINVHTSVSLGPNETKNVVFNPGTDSSLHIDHPQLWWPYQMGDQPLYHLSMETSQNGVRSDSDSETFGIRTIETYLSAPGTHAYDGSRWFAINGKPFVFRGGGMMDQDMFLRYSHDRLAQQIQLIKSMGLNGMRLEGDDQPDDLRADGQGRPAGLRRVPLLRLLGGRVQLVREGSRDELPFCAHPRARAAQPPERDLLELERQHPHQPSGKRGPPGVR